MFYKQTQYIGPELMITSTDDLYIEHGADGADVRAGESDTQAEPAGPLQASAITVIEGEDNEAQPVDENHNDTRLELHPH
jgi:hypothetical protein